MNAVDPQGRLVDKAFRRVAQQFVDGGADVGCGVIRFHPHGVDHRRTFLQQETEARLAARQFLVRLVDGSLTNLQRGGHGIEAARQLAQFAAGGGLSGAGREVPPADAAAGCHQRTHSPHDADLGAGNGQRQGRQQGAQTDCQTLPVFPQQRLAERFLRHADGDMQCVLVGFSRYGEAEIAFYAIQTPHHGRAARRPQYLLHQGMPRIFDGRQGARLGVPIDQLAVMVEHQRHTVVRRNFLLDRAAQLGNIHDGNCHAQSIVCCADHRLGKHDVRGGGDAPANHAADREALLRQRVPEIVHIGKVLADPFRHRSACHATPAIDEAKNQVLRQAHAHVGHISLAAGRVAAMNGNVASHGGQQIMRRRGDPFHPHQRANELQAQVLGLIVHRPLVALIVRHAQSDQRWHRAQKDQQHDAGAQGLPEGQV